MTLIGTSYREHDTARAFGYVTFSGRPADTEHLLINGRSYELDTDGIVDSAGDVLVDISGNSTVDDDITDLASAINNDAAAEVTADADTANDILWLYAKARGTAGNSITLQSDMTNSTASGSTLAHGRLGGQERRHVFRHTITSGEASGGTIRFIAPDLRQVVAFEVRIEDAGAINDATDTKVAITQPNIAVVTEGSSPAWAAGDVLVLELIGIE